VRVLIGLALIGGLMAVERLADLPLLLDPVAAIVFLGLWLALTRADVAKLPLPAPLRRLFP
jgi:hypothetical protein